MSFTEDCEMILNKNGIDTLHMTNKEVRDAWRELFDEGCWTGDW